ncbi:unnamed protein product [Orchesella dallaii]|uniref:Homeobox domain-containing protein n=1 Tax=Orchesella dallaii TaxID=48710 RepID=A0ABP1RRR7_9HEXA
MERNSQVPNPLYTGRPSSGVLYPARSSQQVMRRNTNAVQRKLLEEVFQANSHPNNVAVLKLAFETGLSSGQVKLWFRNRRKKAASAVKIEGVSLNSAKKGVDSGTKTDSSQAASIFSKPSVTRHDSLTDIKDRLLQVQMCPLKRFKELLSTDWKDAAGRLLSLALSKIPIATVIFKEARLLREQILPTWQCLRFRQQEVVYEWMETFLISSRPMSVQKEEELRAVVEFVVLPWLHIFVYAKLILVDGNPVGLSRAICYACKLSNYQVASEYQWQVPSLIES